jgi:hypothetical protein
MAKRSKGTRSERRAGRQRAQRAREHGLPERKEELRARAVTPEPGSVDGEDPASDAPRAPAKAKSAGIPPIAKIVAGALAILVAGYVLTHFRDEPSSETSTTPEVSAPSAAAPPGSVPEPEPQPSTLNPPAPRAPEPTPSTLGAATPAPLVTPVKPVASAPVVSAPAKPQVVAPVVPAPAAPKPAPAKVVAPPASPAPPKPATPAPTPVAPKPATPAPADNPY